MRRTEESQTFTPLIEKPFKEIVKPELKCSLISQESLHEDMSINDFIKSCWPQQIATESEDSSVKVIDNTPKISFKLDDRSDTIRLFNEESDIPFETTDNEFGWESDIQDLVPVTPKEVRKTFVSPKKKFKEQSQKRTSISQKRTVSKSPARSKLSLMQSS